MFGAKLFWYLLIFWNWNLCAVEFWRMALEAPMEYCSLRAVSRPERRCELTKMNFIKCIVNYLWLLLAAMLAFVDLDSLSFRSAMKRSAILEMDFVSEKWPFAGQNSFNFFEAKKKNENTHSRIRMCARQKRIANSVREIINFDLIRAWPLHQIDSRFGTETKNSRHEANHNTITNATSVNTRNLMLTASDDEWSESRLTPIVYIIIIIFTIHFSSPWG